jgi:hypothetical protein
MLALGWRCLAKLCHFDLNQIFTPANSYLRLHSVGDIMRSIIITVLAAGLFVPLSGAHADFQGATHIMPFEEDTIAYSKTPAANRIEKLQARIDTGEVKLDYDEAYGYLLSLLDALEVPKSSQMLVGSKTSLQRERISPQTPRAVYFSDDVYLGWVPGSPLLEISAVDPKLGGVFYTLDQTRMEKQRFIRNDQCLECHASSKTMGVPGHLVRSFVTSETGTVDLLTGVSLVNHRTPFGERWGGWYVTGTHGRQTHRGNLFGKEAIERQEAEPNFRGNLAGLKQFFNTSNYPLPDSDIVALLVLEHQAHMHNMITRLNYAGTMAIEQYGHVNYLKNPIEAFLKYLLFAEEAPLLARVQGTSGFAKIFQEQGPKDSRGRSLRDLDLFSRLFTYPCSYVIYSEAFDALPDKLKERIYERLWEILNDRNTSGDYARLSPELKRAILEILVETKPGLPEYWKNGLSQ